MVELNQQFEQNLEQTLQLHLSPRLLAMLRVLHLSYNEMVEEVTRVAEENPMIEIERPDALAEYLRYLGSDKKLRKQIDLNEYPGIESLKEVSHDLATHLIEQLKLENVDEDTYRLTEELIGRLEPSGYIKEYEKIKEELVGKFGVKPELVDRALELIQSFEPDGVGARDLRESLLIQVREYNFENSELEEVLRQVIEKHLEQIGAKDYRSVAKALGISEEGVIEVANYISSNLNPNPAASFQGESKHVLPSFALENGELINLEEKYGPKIKLSSEYERLMRKKNLDAETQAYLKQKQDKAKELIENLERRGVTMTKIMTIVAEEQKGFFEKGASGLKPLLQKDLAEKLGVHPSTISRAIAEKYIQTKKGLFPIKYLCSRELYGFSPTRIKSLIKDIIAKEDQRHPLTDDEVRDLLMKDGIRIERRTVASYRRDLELPSYSERKKT